MKGKEKDKEWLELKKKEGLSDEKIAELCNCNPVTIFRWRKKLGVPGLDPMDYMSGKKNPYYKITEKKRREIITKSIKNHLKGKNHPNYGKKMPQLSKYVEFTCPICGMTKMVPPYKIKYYKTCSKECGAILRGRNRKGKKLSAAAKRRISEGLPDYHGEKNPNWKTKIKTSCSNCGKVLELIPSHFHENNFCSPECFHDFQRNNIAFRQNLIKKIRKANQQKPNKVEQRIIRIINTHMFPLKYVGDGKLFINGLNPDFISTNGKRKIIEIFGRAFHDPEKALNKNISYNQEELNRVTTLAKANYGTLILWDDKIKIMSDEEIANEIKEFMNI